MPLNQQPTKRKKEEPSLTRILAILKDRAERADRMASNCEPHSRGRELWKEDARENRYAIRILRAAQRKPAKKSK